MQHSVPPPYPNAVLKRVYPWEEYDHTLVLNWLYAQAQKTGFTGDFDDFKNRYGLFIEAMDDQDIQTLIDKYDGIYHVTPMVAIDQVLHTKGKLLSEDIIIEQIPPSVIGNKPLYGGKYNVTPMAHLDQILRTKGTILERNVTVEKIPYTQTTNNAGGYTVNIG